MKARLNSVLIEPKHSLIRALVVPEKRHKRSTEEEHCHREKHM
jgi:hypothetical protein